MKPVTRPLTHRLANLPTNGLAVISVLVILPVVALVAVAIIVLARSSTQVNQIENHAAIARSNARLALNFAFGQLQSQLGPDTRVTANALILDPNSNSADTTLANPRWTGVWSTQNPDGQFIIRRDDDQIGLQDQRVQNGTLPRPEARTWLVSNGNIASPMDNIDPANSVPMVSMGSVDQAQLATDQVTVPRLQVGENQSIAWWVGDLGQRAKLRSRQESAQLAASNTTTPAFADPLGIDPNLDESITTDQRVISKQSVDLASSNEFSRRYFHDFTVDGYGVLANTRNGGLKQDLTQFINLTSRQGSARIPDMRDRGEVISRGLQDRDHLIGPGNSQHARLENMNWGREYRHQTSAPLFGLFRDWWAQGQQIRGNSARPMQLVENDNNPRFRHGQGQTAVLFQGAQTTPFQPIITEASCSFTISTFRAMIDTEQGQREGFNLMTNLFPRVVMWNPYNIPMEVPRLSHLLHVSGGKPIVVTTAQGFITQQFTDRRYPSSHSGAIKPPTGNSSDNPRVLDGHYLFATEAVRMEPGECLAFIPAGKRPYNPDPLTVDVMNHLLVPTAGDFMDRFFYHPGTPIVHATTANIAQLDADTGRGYLNRPIRWRPNPQQTLDEIEDVRHFVRTAPASGPLIGTAGFSAQQLMVFLSASATFGTVYDAPLTWADSVEEPIDLVDIENPQLVTPPNFRTVEGIRLRWFDETQANKQASGGLSPRSLQVAPLATWNPRGVLAQRTPFDNTSPIPPFHHGTHIRELADPILSPSFNQPIPGNGGRLLANPFGPHQEAQPRYVLYDFARETIPPVSLGMLQHVNISPFAWHPGSPIGNSWADPRVPATGTAPETPSPTRGWNAESLGTYSTVGEDTVARLGRNLAQRINESENIVYDLSFEVNDRLWDRFFLSGATPQQLRQFAQQTDSPPLPNSRLIPVNWSQPNEPGSLATVADFHKWGLYLGIDGAFNVNSTSERAWAALLRSARFAAINQPNEISFPRVFEPTADVFDPTSGPDQNTTFDGRRVLTDEQIDALANAIVNQVKLRGPFYSLGDFINRRLVEDETGLMGTLQAAIAASGINEVFDQPSSPFAIDLNELPNTRISHPRGPSMQRSNRLAQARKPVSQAANAPSYLTQADLLQWLAPSLSARSDTFVIRAYGESRDAQGNVVARAWCEAVAQRTPEPINPISDNLPLNHPPLDENQGRRFQLSSFRWLTADEV